MHAIRFLLLVASSTALPVQSNAGKSISISIDMTKANSTDVLALEKRTPQLNGIWSGFLGGLGDSLGTQVGGSAGGAVKDLGGALSTLLSPGEPTPGLGASLTSLGASLGKGLGGLLGSMVSEGKDGVDEEGARPVPYASNQGPADWSQPMPQQYQPVPQMQSQPVPQGPFQPVQQGFY
jgi:hypothetical protein